MPKTVAELKKGLTDCDFLWDWSQTFSGKPKDMMAEVLEWFVAHNPKDHIIIDSGEYRFPLLAADVHQYEEKTGVGMAELRTALYANNGIYEAFCGAIKPVLDVPVGGLAYEACDVLCHWLVERGAAVWILNVDGLPSTPCQGNFSFCKLPHRVVMTNADIELITLEKMHYAIDYCEFVGKWAKKFNSTRGGCDADTVNEIETKCRKFTGNAIEFFLEGKYTSSQDCAEKVHRLVKEFLYCPTLSARCREILAGEPRGRI